MGLSLPVTVAKMDQAAYFVRRILTLENGRKIELSGCFHMKKWRETISELPRWLIQQRLTIPKRSVSEINASANSRESTMISQAQNVQSGKNNNEPLDRDESRFRYFHPNGKALLRADASKFLSVKTSYERAQETAA